jgi:hypothetical protein
MVQLLALFEIGGQYRLLDTSRVMFPSLTGIRFEPTDQWKYSGGVAKPTCLT